MKRYATSTLFFLPLLTALLLTGSCGSSNDAGSWTALFDGESLEGWRIIPGGQWRVEQGLIIGTSTPDEPRHGILLTEERYGDFRLRLEFKCLKGNSGLYFRVDTVKSAVSVNGFQAEIDQEKDIGGLYETGGRQWVVQPSPEQVESFFVKGEWNTMAVSALGRQVTVEVNGVVTAQLSDDPGRTEGFIGLQLHGNMEMLVMFRNIEIQIL